MASSIQRRRGTTSDHATFTGAVGEITIDTTKDTVVVHDGAVVGGVPLLREDGSNSSLALGSQEAPSLKFSGDPDTGIFSPGADQLAISTNGVERVKFGTTATEVVFNDTGVNYDFRIEGDTVDSLFFVDASTDRVGIGTSSPGQKLDVNGEIVCSPNTAGKNTFQFTTQAANDASLIMRADTLIKVNIQANGTSYFNGGNVGIGTTTPGTARTFIQCDDTNTTGLTINSTGASTGVSGFSNLKLTGNTPNNVTQQYGVEQIKIQSYVENITGFYSDIAGTYGPTINFHAKLAKNLAAATNGYCYYADLSTSNSGGSAYFAYFYNSTSSAERFSITSAGTATLTSAASTAPFITKIGSSEVSRIDSSGRLLVGTSSSRSNFNNAGGNDPLFQIERAGGVGSLASIVRNENDAFGPVLEIGKSRGTAVGSYAAVSNNGVGDNLGRIYFNGSDGTDMVPGAAVEAFVDGAPGANDMPGRLVFSTNPGSPATSPTERMRIGSAGDIGINTTSTNYGGADFKLAVSSSNYLFALNTTSSGADMINFYTTSGFVGKISTTTSSTAYSTSSDYRLKENVTTVTDGITRFKQLKPSRFNFIADPGKTVDGFLAHEAQAIVPECVTGEKDAVDDDGNPVYQGIDQAKLVPLLTAALQEAITKIETLEQRLTAAGID